MAYEKTATVIARLIKRTNAGQVKWEPTVEQGAFQLSFPGSSVVLLARESGRYEDDVEYVFRVNNESGDILEEVTETTLREVPTAVRDLRALYLAVRRQALGVDAVLDSILGALPDDEDIPF